MDHNRKSRFWVAIGSPRAVRFIFAGMLVYALVIGGLMLGYAQVQSCLANYSEDAAASTRVRAEAAAQDRTLNNRTEAVNLSDRQRIIINQRATKSLIDDLIDDGQSDDAAFINYNKVNVESLRIFSENEKERNAIGAERLKVEKLRNTAPPPESPSETC